MKLSSLLFAVLLECLALNSQAAEISAGAEVSPLIVWADQCVWLIFCSQESLGGHSNGYGFRVGLRLPHDDANFTSLEIGYDKPGSISGSTVYSLTPGCIILCPGANATWKHQTSITHVSALGSLPWDSHKEHGAVIGKIGLYKSTTTTEGDYGTGGGAYSRQVSGAGLLLGAGYIFPFVEHLSARAAADIFFKVKVADPLNTGGTIPETLVKLSLGMDYTF
ncbi:MAG: hypothetical protein WA635_07375 [Gallionella sp.]